MSYTQCPHCHRIAGKHGSVISKSIGSPLITCENCKRQIIDNNMYEWGAIPIESRLNYCLLSNYRISIHWFAFIFPACIMANSSFFIGLLLWVIIEALVCPFLYYCVTWLNGAEIEKSINRSKNADYIDCLAEFGYDKLDLKLYNEYLDRRNTKLKLIKSEPFAAKISANAEAEKNVVVEEVKQPSAALANKSDSLFKSVISAQSKPKRELSDSEKCQIAFDRWKNRKKEDWDIGIEYERYVGYLLECKGYKVSYIGATKGLNDMGRDLIATKKGKTLVIQCKRWSKEKTIHEKHIFQLHGSTAVLSAQNPDKTYKAVFITTTELSETARKCAEICNVALVEKFQMADYPLIKCNLNKDGEKIYHLPFDPQYDKIVISKNKKSCYVWTIKEAEDLGFRHTYHWRSNKS